MTSRVDLTGDAPSSARSRQVVDLSGPAAARGGGFGSGGGGARADALTIWAINLPLTWGIKQLTLMLGEEKIDTIDTLIDPVTHSTVQVHQIARIICVSSKAAASVRSFLHASNEGGHIGRCIGPLTKAEEAFPRHPGPTALSVSSCELRDDLILPWAKWFDTNATILPDRTDAGATVIRFQTQMAAAAARLFLPSILARATGTKASAQDVRPDPHTGCCQLCFTLYGLKGDRAETSQRKVVVEVVHLDQKAMHAKPATPAAPKPAVKSEPSPPTPAAASKSSAPSSVAASKSSPPTPASASTPVKSEPSPPPAATHAAASKPPAVGAAAPTPVSAKPERSPPAIASPLPAPVSIPAEGLPEPATISLSPFTPLLSVDNPLPVASPQSAPLPVPSPPLPSSQSLPLPSPSTPSSAPLKNETNTSSLISSLYSSIATLLPNSPAVSMQLSQSQPPPPAAQQIRSEPQAQVRRTNSGGLASYVPPPSASPPVPSPPATRDTPLSPISAAVRATLTSPPSSGRFIMPAAHVNSPPPQRPRQPVVDTQAKTTDLPLSPPGSSAAVGEERWRSGGGGHRSPGSAHRRRSRSRSREREHQRMHSGDSSHRGTHASHHTRDSDRDSRSHFEHQGDYRDSHDPRDGRGQHFDRHGGNGGGGGGDDRWRSPSSQAGGASASSSSRGLEPYSAENSGRWSMTPSAEESELQRSRDQIRAERRGDYEQRSGPSSSSVQHRDDRYRRDDRR